MDERYQSWDEVLDDIKRMGSRKIVLQKGGTQAPSTISLKTASDSSQSAESAPAATTQASLVIIIWRIIKWAAVALLWTSLANKLMNPPL